MLVFAGLFVLSFFQGYAERNRTLAGLPARLLSSSALLRRLHRAHDPLVLLAACLAERRWSRPRHRQVDRPAELLEVRPRVRGVDSAATGMLSTLQNWQRELPATLGERYELRHAHDCHRGLGAGRMLPTGGCATVAPSPNVGSPLPSRHAS